MSIQVLIGIAIAIALLTAVSAMARSGGSGQRSGPGLVTGLMLGCFVGGATTIGTAQLAYTHGLAAWCYSFGGFFGCLVMGWIYARRLQMEGGRTVVGIIANEYGTRVGATASLLIPAGMFIGLYAQLFAAVSLVSTFAPGVAPTAAMSAAAALMLLYIVFGGVRSATLAGILKITLLTIAMFSCAAITLSDTGGPAGFLAMVDEMQKTSTRDLMDFFGRGMGKEISAWCSLVVGFVTTQIQVQNASSARSPAAARIGSAASAFMIPVLGGCGVLVGLWMRAHCPGIDPKVALTQFILTQMPGIPAGIALGALLITVVGTGAGIVLGITTIMRKDIIERLGLMRSLSPMATERILMAAVLALAVFISTFMTSDLILMYSVASMGIRGSVAFLPMTCALWAKSRIPAQYALLSVVVAPVTVVTLMLADVLPISPLYVGIAASAAIMAAGYFRHRTPAR